MVWQALAIKQLEDPAERTRCIHDIENYGYDWEDEEGKPYSEVRDFSAWVRSVDFDVRMVRIQATRPDLIAGGRALFRRINP